MGQMGLDTTYGHGALRAALGLGATVLALLLAAATAHATAYEQVGTFAGSATPVTEEEILADEEVQLAGASGMAVNYTGAGGVPAGTVYAVGANSESTRIAMYEPGAEGPRFAEAWQAKTTEPYAVCGPEAEALPDGSPPFAHPGCAPRVEGPARGRDVDVNQATGNVYVYLGASVVGAEQIVEYAPDGSRVIARFGELAPYADTVAESPGKIHTSPYPGGIAVNGAGDVYVFDFGSPGTYSRLMVFKPESPGDYEHYEYAGEVAAGPLAEHEFPTMPVIDAAGDIYVAGVEGNYIEEYAPEIPAAYPAPASTPICTFTFTRTGITAIAVDPETGEPFFYNLKRESKLKWVYQLGACEGGEFEVTGKAQVSPERGDLWALAFDPVHRADPSRPPGTLYGAAAGAIPELVGSGEPGQSSLGYIFAGPAEAVSEHTLTVNVSGEGSVSADAGTISGCASAGGAACEGEYEEGATVTLTETPGAEQEFKGWGTPQCDESTADTCEVTIGAEDEAVSAAFEPTPPSGPPLTLAIEEGQGTVVSDPAGIECSGEAPRSCTSEEIEEGSTVTLTASPAPGYLFKSWRKCDAGGVAGRRCTLTLSEAKEVGAKFVRVWSLSAAKATGSGPGILSTTPGGINCGYTCNSATALYRQGTVTVKSKPAKHFHLVEFSGGTGSAAACDGEAACSFTIAEDSSIEELYAEDAKNTFSLAKAGGGQGSVKTKPTNVNCGYACGSASAEFFAAEEPEVTVALGKGTSQVTWESGAGTCTGHATTCKVPMSASHSLVARFE